MAKKKPTSKPPATPKPSGGSAVTKGAKKATQ